MAYYADLSPHFRQRKVLNVGWLDRKHGFETARPAKWMIERLWVFCRYSILSAGGFHECNLADCPGPCKKLRENYSRGKRPTIREILEADALARKQLVSGPLARLSKASKAEMSARLDEALNRAQRGFAKMTLAVRPQTGEQVELGYAEIRVLGERGKMYAAPNMLYHYVTVHHYKPPDEFVQALKKGPCPPNEEYLAGLAMVGFPLFLVKLYQAMWKENVPGFY